MALFQKSTTPKKAPSAKKPAKSGKKVVLPKAKIEVQPSLLAHRYLLRPRITEKSYALNSANQFVFEVSKDAHKSVIARSVQEVYGVEVVDVRTVNLPGKSKVFGKKGQTGSRSGVKKAIVTIKAGQSIELLGASI